MAKRIFKFRGTSASKFFIAGMNYVSKVPCLNRDKVTLVQYITNNKEEVCADGCSKGFCTGSCKTCKVQGAYEKGLIVIALKPDIQVTANKEVPPCKRHNMTFEQYRKYCKENNL